MIINDFFDADLDLTLKFSVGLRPAGELRLRLGDVDAEVKFHLLEHILSLGSAPLIQGVAQAVVAATAEAFLGPQLEKELATPLQEIMLTLCQGGGRADFRLTSVRALDGVLQFDCCGLSEDARFLDVLQSASVLA